MNRIRAPTGSNGNRADGANPIEQNEQFLLENFIERLWI